MAGAAAELPPEGERLLAAAPEEFAAERARVARGLRDEGRPDEARRVAELRKPPLVVLAVNRAARDRPQAARDAADAAERVRAAQLSGDAEAYGKARDDLERASALLAEVAVARLSRGKRPGQAMRRRVSDLLRAATADDAARESLVRGVLADELEAPGFAPFAGASFAAPAPRRTNEPEAGRRAERRRARERELRAELEQAKRELEAAERDVVEATRKRERAERAVASLQKKLERL